MATKVTKLSDAEDWWDGLSESEKAIQRAKFKSAYAPTNAELIAAYDHAHNGAKAGASTPSKATPTRDPSMLEQSMPKINQAKAWWNGLSDADKAGFKTGFVNGQTPTDEELTKAYDEAYGDGAVSADRARGWWNALYPEERAALKLKYVDAPDDDEVIRVYEETHKSGAPALQHTGEEPPTVQAATPYASGTNPDLIRNDAIPGENTAIYDKSPIPGGYQPPPPPEPLP
jgi:hypothetical protein